MEKLHESAQGAQDAASGGAVEEESADTMRAAAQRRRRAMRKAAAPEGGGGLAPQAATALDAADRAGGGAPLAGGMRQQFESSLGADLGGVRVHTGSQSGQAAQAIQAHAYTVGQDIHFAPGRYQPESADGQKLIAH